MAYGTCSYCGSFAPLMQVTGCKWICEDCFLTEQEFNDYEEMMDEIEEEDKQYEAEFGDGGWKTLPPEQNHD